jgi:putative intracellular protease/amidase
MTKILIIVTNQNIIPKNNKQTGYYLPEVAHPYHVFIQAGFAVDFASPLGGLSPCDEGSIQAYANDKICQEFQKDEKVQHALKHTHKVEDLKSSDYAAIFFAGGHGPMFDIPTHKPTLKISAEIYEAHGVVSAVCHGPCGLVNITLKNGEHLIKGKKVCGFTNSEEEAVKLVEAMPFSLEDKLKESGGIFVGAPDWSANVQVDQNVVTGQNPASATGTAEAIVKLLKK